MEKGRLNSTATQLVPPSGGSGSPGETKSLKIGIPALPPRREDSSKL